VRLLVASGLIVLAALTWSCGGSDAGSANPTFVGGQPTENDATFPPVTPPERPGGVPDTAEPIVQTRLLGHIERQANQEPQGVDTRTLTAAECLDDVMTLTTSDEKIYSGLPCDRFWTQEAIDAFVGQEVAVTLEVTPERFRILIETLPGGQSEFTVNGIWVA
jgi:hypothetical protein